MQKTIRPIYNYNITSGITVTTTGTAKLTHIMPLMVCGMRISEWSWSELDEIQACQNAPGLLVINKSKSCNKDPYNYSDTAKVFVGGYD